MPFPLYFQRYFDLTNKPEKIPLRNTSLIAALTEGAMNKGDLRETFFLSQVTIVEQRSLIPQKADFLADGKFLFEIGEGIRRGHKSLDERMLFWLWMKLNTASVKKSRCGSSASSTELTLFSYNPNS